MQVVNFECQRLLVRFHYLQVSNIRLLLAYDALALDKVALEYDGNSNIAKLRQHANAAESSALKLALHVEVALTAVMSAFTGKSSHHIPYSVLRLQTSWTLFGSAHVTLGLSITGRCP